MKPFFAIVYELCLDGDGVAKDDPLYETSYIGQSGRYASSPEEALEMRWAEHKQKAKSDPKECGLKWALNKYGPAAFSKRVICFLKFSSRCVQALDYMNAVEIEEIDCRGGIMQDIEPPAPLWQTFNLTIGGQEDPGAKFASLQAKQERTWKRLQEKVLELVAETGTCLCRQDCTLKCGYRIGNALNLVRSQHRFLNDVETAAERTKWLEDLPGWSWTIALDNNAVAWSLFQEELLVHVRTFDTANVEQSHVSPSGYKLGIHVAHVRTGTFLSGNTAKERTDWLNTLPGWVWNAEAFRYVKDPVKEEARVAKILEARKRKREERWATLNEVELAEAKHHFDVSQKAQDKYNEKRKAKARGEAPEPKQPPKPKTAKYIRDKAKRKADLAALRATLVPKAQRHQLARYRQDGTVAKAHQILRERSVDAGV